MHKEVLVVLTTFLVCRCCGGGGVGCYGSFTNGYNESFGVR